MTEQTGRIQLELVHGLFWTDNREEALTRSLTDNADVGMLPALQVIWANLNQATFSGS